MDTQEIDQSLGDQRKTLQKKQATRRKSNTITIWIMAILLGIASFFMLIANSREIQFISQSIVAQGIVMKQGTMACSSRLRDSWHANYITVQFTTETGDIQAAKIDGCDADSPYLTTSEGQMVPIRYMPSDPAWAEIDGVSSHKLQIYTLISAGAGILALLLVLWGTLRVAADRH
ncbi:hypothetical protein KSD_01310 [Ktedonobacter sp. SOSP1-85]|uniref:DUF3592 domain-containing protein n=1 Tax=Ktedonobacter sp. SOSP1-85 TaxID=2778367 RepID=UPI001916B3EA|nr:DUF3592 domain-containing protein [Ktedonobacter sp. SOSP1-85]GHO72360.1 hypothetical protein KSD_01310 [Ktedonobacter sp. SOSP1-85]